MLLIIIEKLNNDLKNKANRNKNKQLVKLIFDQVCIVEGQPIHDTAAFAKRFDYVLEKIAMDYKSLINLISGK